MHFLLKREIFQLCWQRWSRRVPFTKPSFLVWFFSRVYISTYIFISSAVLTFHDPPSGGLNMEDARGEKVANFTDTYSTSHGSGWSDLGPHDLFAKRIGCFLGPWDLIWGWWYLESALGYLESTQIRFILNIIGGCLALILLIMWEEGWQELMINPLSLWWLFLWMMGILKTPTWMMVWHCLQFIHISPSMPR